MAIKELIDLALRLGVTRVREIKPGSIVVQDDVVEEGCAGCPEYARHLLCPPALPPPREFRKRLKGYKRAILLQLDAYCGEERTSAVQASVYAQSTRLHLIICAIEDKAVELGFQQVLGLIGGCCRLCGNCPGLGESCRDPGKARSSMEANGINVVETCSASGWPLEFPVTNRVAWTGLLLLGGTFKRAPRTL